MLSATESSSPTSRAGRSPRLIREELARRRISRQRLADQAKISISTLEKALSGRRPFTLATTIRLEEALGVALRKRNDDARRAGSASAVAPDELGSYARPAVSWIEGVYLTLRPSFGDKDAIYAYRTEILWDDGCSILIFRESERSTPPSRNTARVGAEPVRPHLSRDQPPRAISADHRGAADHQRRDARHPHHAAGRPRLAAHAGRRADRVRAGARMSPTAFGRIASGHPCYERYRNYLKRTVEEPFALFLPG